MLPANLSVYDMGDVQLASVKRSAGRLHTITRRTKIGFLIVVDPFKTAPRATIVAITGTLAGQPFGWPVDKNRSRLK
ncbi:MAG: hypothetical protein HY243_12565 [Proteobacteria bacterium]|nr:hypothetical protein [Pseudomonadota bacterium]